MALRLSFIQERTKRRVGPLTSVQLAAVGLGHQSPRRFFSGRRGETVPTLSLDSIAHKEGQADMNNGEDGEGITKRPVDHVPELKDALRAAEEGDALGELGLRFGEVQSALEPMVTRGQQAKERENPSAKTCLLQADPGGSERTLEIDEDHGDQGNDRGSFGHLRRGRQLVQSVYGKAESGALFGELFLQRGFLLLNFLHGEFRGAQVARNLRIEIASDKPAQSNHHHAPERHAGNVAELKRGMKRDDDGGGGAEHDMEIQPVAGIPLSAEPAPLFAKRIEVDQEEHQDTQHAEPDANGPAGAQEIMLGGEGALGGAEQVIVIAVAANDQHDG